MNNQLGVLDDIVPGTVANHPLWTVNDVTLVTTEGGRDDRKELLDRVLLQLAQVVLHDDRRLGGFLVRVYRVLMRALLRQGTGVSGGVGPDLDSGVIATHLVPTRLREGRVESSGEM